MFTQKGLFLVEIDFDEDGIPEPWLAAQCIEDRGLRPAGWTPGRVYVDHDGLALSLSSRERFG
mgnify:CR=1 FL=1